MSGSQLLAARKRAKVNQEEVVDRVPGLNYHILAAIEDGRVNPSRELSDAIAEAIKTLKQEREDGLSSRV